MPTPRQSLSFLDAAAEILRERGQPAHCKEVTQEAVERGLIATSGKTPAATLRAQISVDSKRRAARGSKPRFSIPGRGLIGLAEWDAGPQSPIPTRGDQPGAKLIAGSRRLSFLDAAAEILTAVGQPLHYREITSQALERGLIETSGLTPAATMRAQISQENQRRARRGEQPRFEALGRGLIALTSRQDSTPIAQVEAHNKVVRDALLAQLGCEARAAASAGDRPTEARPAAEHHDDLRDSQHTLAARRPGAGALGGGRCARAEDDAALAGGPAP